MTEQRLLRQVLEIRPRWLLWLAGSLSVLAGILAVLFPLAAAVGFEIFLGVALVIVGGFELGRAFTLRKAGRILAVTLYGVLAVGTGVVLVLFPAPGVAALSLVVATFLIAGGIIKMWGAFGWRARPGWPWMMVSGILSLILGGLMLALMPIGAIWLLGLLIGVDLLFFGISQLAFASGSIRLPEKPH